MTEIKNIIFDMGGVLVDLDKNRCIKAFEKIGMQDIATYVSEHRCEDLFFDLEIGNIDIPAFCEQARKITGLTVDDEKIEWAWNELLGEIAPWKVERLKELGGKYRLFLLSNTNPIHWGKCAPTLSSFFEKIFLSYEMHLAKPSKEIFLQVLAQGKMEATETVFLDDSAANCEAARAVGINAIKVDINGQWPEIE